MKMHKDTFFYSYLLVWTIIVLIDYTWVHWFNPDYVALAFLLPLAILLPIKHKIFIE